MNKMRLIKEKSTEFMFESDSEVVTPIKKKNPENEEFVLSESDRKKILR